MLRQSVSSRPMWARSSSVQSVPGDGAIPAISPKLGFGRASSELKTLRQLRRRMNVGAHGLDFTPGLAAILGDARNFSTGVLHYAARTSIGQRPHCHMRNDRHRGVRNDNPARRNMFEIAFDKLLK